VKHRFVRVFILLLAAIVPGAAAQEAGGPPPVEVSRISPTLYQLRCNGNVAVLASVGKDGTLLVDTGYTGTAAAVREELTKLGSGPVRMVVNTHGDMDHVGGNAELGRGAVIIASPNVSRRMSTYFALPPVETAGLPMLTLDGAATVQFNDDLIRIIPIPGGHTDGDVIVHFTRSGIACVGDLVLLGTFPNADPARGGDAQRLIEVLAEIQKILPPDTTLVAAHGGSFTMAELEIYIGMVRGTVAAVAAEMDAGNTLEEIITHNPLAPWSDWESPENGLSFERWTTEVYASLGGEGPQSICAPVTEALEQSGAEAAVARYRRLKNSEPERWTLGENELNMLGYQLLARDRIDEAVVIFKLNVEAYPEAFNTYDSLGEALMLAGQTSDAITSYERSLELNPNNTNAVAMLDRLRDE